MAWYRAGTVSVTNGQKLVTGAGTIFSLNVKPGDAFNLDGAKLYEVDYLDIADPNHKLYLKEVYSGATAAAQAYSIMALSTVAMSTANLANQVSALLNSWQGREDEYRAWQAGSATVTPPGSPQAGYYPMTDPLGVTSYIACPAKINLEASTKSPLAGPGPTGDFSVRTLTANGQISSAATNDAFRSVSPSTSWRGIRLGNTGGDVVLGMDSSLGGTVAGSQPYDGFLIAPSGLSVSANGGATNHLRIDSSGNLLVGATTQVATERLRVNSVNSFTAALVSTHNVSGDTCLYMEMGANTDNSSSCFINASKSGVGQRFYVLGNGNCQNINNSYGAISDLRLKENISTARNYLSDLCKVNIVKYSLKIDHETTGTHLGVIAQELEEIFPGMIEVTNDTAERPSGKFEQKEIAPAVMDGEQIVTHAVMGDDETKPIIERYETGESTKGVKYSIFVPMLITAVQSLKAQNEALEARLTALEAR